LGRGGCSDWAKGPSQGHGLDLCALFAGLPLGMTHAGYFVYLRTIKSLETLKYDMAGRTRASQDAPEPRVAPHWAPWPHEALGSSGAIICVLGHAGARGAPRASERALMSQHETR
jgi:hypothetical protein